MNQKEKNVDSSVYPQPVETPKQYIWESVMIAIYGPGKWINEKLG